MWPGGENAVHEHALGPPVHFADHVRAARFRLDRRAWTGESVEEERPGLGGQPGGESEQFVEKIGVGHGSTVGAGSPRAESAQSFPRTVVSVSARLSERHSPMARNARIARMPVPNAVPTDPTTVHRPILIPDALPDMTLRTA